MLIAVKAEIDRHPALSKAAANESGVARLQCRAEGAREVSFSWRRNNVELRGPKYEVFQRRVEGSYVQWESELVISDVRTSDYGNYTCVAQSDLGSDHAQVLLTTIGEFSSRLLLLFQVMIFSYTSIVFPLRGTSRLSADWQSTTVFRGCPTNAACPRCSRKALADISTWK